MSKGKYPSHKGEVQIKLPDGKFEKIGESAVWASEDGGFLSGVLKFEAGKVSPNEHGILEVRFMAKR